MSSEKPGGTWHLAPSKCGTGGTRGKWQEERIFAIVVVVS